MRQFLDCGSPLPLFTLRSKAPTGGTLPNTKLGFACHFFIIPAVQFIRDIYAAKLAAKRPVVSLEFFPPKTDEGDRALLGKHIPTLAQVKPDFCSVTYGAGGSTRDKTLMIVERIQREHQLTALAHLTCVNHTREEVRALLDKIRALGCKNILALRGDPPSGGEFKVMPGGFEFAAQLVQFIRGQNEFSIGVAGFPEGHIANKIGKHDDWRHLQEKVDAGADFVLTQLFFDNSDYFEFRDYVTGKLGVRVPIVPGMVSILSASQIMKFTRLCGAKIPAPLANKLERLKDDDEACVEFGIEYATRQCEELLRAGAPGLHFYTLNKSRSTTQVVKNLGLAQSK
jgi:methylenetetrahydrofolate reductase (NADH)